MTTALAKPATDASAQPSGFGLMLSPATIEAAKDLANTLAKSGLVPQAYSGKPEAILIAGAMGHRLGLDIFSAMAGIAVINGRPTLWGDAMLAICQAHPQWVSMAVKIDAEEGSAEVTITRKNHPTPYVGRFSMAEAKVAGLAGKQGPWSQYPQRMVELRARSYALRAAFADALSGFHCAEEMQDVEPREVVGTVVPDASPAKEREIPKDNQAAPAAVEKSGGAAASPASADGAPAAGDGQQSIAETKPKPATIPDCVEYSKKMAADFKASEPGKPSGIQAIRDVLALPEIGADKIQNVAPEKAEACMKALVAAREKLAGGAK